MNVSRHSSIRSGGRGSEQVEGRVDFAQALAALQEGKRVKRAKWANQGATLRMVRHAKLEAADGEVFVQEDGSGVHSPLIAFETQDGKLRPWLALQVELLATDWMIEQ